jgi:hypothetical protein
MFAVVCVVGVAAQTSSARTLPLADVPGSWVADVSTSGGFTGRGKGGLTVDSAGMMLCTAPMLCAGIARPGSLAPVADALAHLRTPAWGDPRRTGLCRDCYTTTLTLRSRQPDGGEARSVFVWTDTDFAGIPPDVRTAYASVMALVEQRR